MQEVGILEIASFDWDCDIYEKYLGPCQDHLDDDDYIINNHINPYFDELMKFYGINSLFHETIKIQIIDKWRSLKRTRNSTEVVI